MEIESGGNTTSDAELASTINHGAVMKSPVAPADNNANSAFKVPTLFLRQRAPVPVENVSITMENRLLERESTASPPLAHKPCPSSTSNATNAKETSEQQITSSTVDNINRTIPAKTTDVPYDVPSWSGLPNPDFSYSFEILKGGVILGSFDLSARPYVICGRHVSCDLVMEHPSISRHHAVIQYRRCDSSRVSAPEDKVSNEERSRRPDGFYVYDLGSTHGTFLNKSQLKPRRYYRLFVGHMLRFGGSSRSYLMQGPEDDCEEESPLTVTELNALRRLAEQKAALAVEVANKKTVDEENQGIDWGMSEDAVEDDDDSGHGRDDDDEEESVLGINPFALNAATPNEDTYIDDPKKTLRSWFEREGFELEYDIEEKGQAHFLCRIRLPLDHSASGQPIIVEAAVKGKKKEAVAAAALEACRTLDRQGVLRKSKQEGRPRKKKRDWAEDDYYDSDDDTFLDRTGAVEKKRQQRMMHRKSADDAVSESNTGVETYESLLAKYAKVTEDLLRIDETLNKSTKTRDADDANADADDVDALDAYMRSLHGAGATSVPDKTEKSRLKVSRQQLRREAERLTRLIKIATPTALPSLVVVGSSSTTDATTTTSMKTPISNSCDASSAKITKRDEVIPELKKRRSCSNLRLDENSLLQTKRESSNTQPDQVDERLLEAPVEVPAGATKSCNTDQDDQQLESRVTMADSSACSQDGASVINVVEEPKKKRHKAIRKSREARCDYDKTDPNYAMWIPPDDQSGDGRTSLNEKYGY